MMSVNAMLRKSLAFDFDRGNIYFSDPDNRFSMWIDQYMPEVSQNYVDEIYQHIGYLEDMTFIAEPVTDRQSLIFEIPADHNQMEVDLPIIRYKNTTVFVNGRKAIIDSSYRGTVQLMVNKGLNQIKIEYSTSPIIKVGVLISVITWILLSLYLVEVIIKNKELKVVSKVKLKRRK